jgi:hypothetical protein
VYEALGEEIFESAPQQEKMLDCIVTDLVRKEGMEALTPERLEGINEMVTIYLWDRVLASS